MELVLVLAIVAGVIANTILALTWSAEPVRRGRSARRLPRFGPRRQR